MYFFFTFTFWILGLGRILGHTGKQKADFVTEPFLGIEYIERGVAGTYGPNVVINA